MYGRDYAGKTLNFEPSGGLTNASLVMQDRQTDTYWSLMKGKAVAGELKGQSLSELPLGEKTTWKEWRTQHPNTKVLSVNSREDGPNPYRRYFTDPKGFRGLAARDARLDTKTPIFAFRWDEKAYAINHQYLVGGCALPLPKGGELFAFRGKADKIFRSTSVYVSPTGFTNKNGRWIEDRSGAAFDVKARSFQDAAIEKFGGFDTFWYNWSLNNPETQLIIRPTAAQEGSTTR